MEELASYIRLLYLLRVGSLSQNGFGRRPPSEFCEVGFHLFQLTLEFIANPFLLLNLSLNLFAHARYSLLLCLVVTVLQPLDLLQQLLSLLFGTVELRSHVIP